MSGTQRKSYILSGYLTQEPDMRLHVGNENIVFFKYKFYQNANVTTEIRLETKEISFPILIHKNFFLIIQTSTLDTLCANNDFTFLLDSHLKIRF